MTCRSTCLVWPLPALALSLIVGLPAPSLAAEADDEPPSDSTVAFDDERTTDENPTLALDYRLWGLAGPDHRSAGDVYPGGLPSGMVHQRLRLGLRGAIGPIRAVTEADLVTGRLSGQRPEPTPRGTSSGTSVDGDLSTRQNILSPRAVYLAFQSRAIGRITAGLQTSDWGLGILAHDGASDPNALFNHYYGGDRSFRLMFATAPFAKSRRSTVRDDLIVAVGADYVYRDENAAMWRGDRARQAVAAVLYRGDRFRTGNYVTYRRQTDGDGDTLSALVTDYYLESLWSPSEAWRLRLGAEAALLLGETTRVESPATGESVDLRGMGTAWEFEAIYRPAQLRLQLKSGYASGDRNSSDATVQRFRFDPNYRVGLVLFDHYLPSVSRDAYARLIDPRRSAEPPKGAEQLVHDGSVTNAMYLNPMLIFGRREGLTTGLGLLWARAPTRLTDPYATFANGGTPTGPNGVTPASRDLGWEIDVAARYRHRLVERFALEFKAEYGVFFPGRAFADADGHSAPPATLLRASVGAGW